MGDRCKIKPTAAPREALVPYCVYCCCTKTLLTAADSAAIMETRAGNEKEKGASSCIADAKLVYPSWASRESSSIASSFTSEGRGGGDCGRGGVGERGKSLWQGTGGVII